MKITRSFSGRSSKALAVLILFSSISIQFLQGQGWYDGNWQNRVPVTINNTGTALSNFQVQVIISGPSFAWGNTLPGGIDIRFTDDTGMTPIDFWIESWNAAGQTASIWVEVPAVKASPDVTTIFMYYNNPAVISSTSNGVATFDFFDDFNSTTLDFGIGGRWAASGGDWSVQSDTQQDGTVGNVAQGIAGVSYRILKSSFSGGDYVFEGWGKQVTGRTWGFGIRTTDVTHTYSLNLYEDINDMYFYSWNGVGNATIVYSADQGEISMNTWYKLKVKAHGSNFDIYFNDQLRTTGTNAQWTTGAIALFLDPNQTARYNDVRVRKWTASEPSVAVGSVQTPSINVTNTVNNVQCNGGSNGAITLSVSGGTPPYTYDWTGPNGFTSNSKDITGLIAGTYSVIVRDNASNQMGQNVIVTQPEPISLSYQITVAPTCTTQATLLISATGGTSPYTGTGSVNQGFGTVVYNVSDDNGCPASISVTMTRSAGWLDPAWQYRDSVQIANPGGTTLTDFQVHVALTNTFNFSRASLDGSDIRFTSSDGTTVLPFWIESWSRSAATASIWVKVNAIPTTGEVIYMYYGNSSASPSSSGDQTFEFFDDFGSTSGGQQPGYFEFGPESTIMQQNYAYNEGSSPHTLSVVESPGITAYAGASGPYTYYGYYGPQASGWIGIAGSYDLLTWTRLPYNPPPNSGVNNPLFAGHGERWPSVFKDGSTYYMVHTMTYGAPSYLVYRTSSDGLSWSAPTTLIQDGANNQNPSLFKDPNTGTYYLYWYRGENGWSIMAKSASTVAGLVTATPQLLISSSVTLAAPQMMYYGGVYYLATEILEGVWKVRMYASTSPTGPFTILPGNPVLDDGSACLFQHLIGTKIYEYYCKQASNGTWTLDMRVVDPTTGRLMYEEGFLDDSKWTADGGTWTIQMTTQQDGTEGFVVQGSTSDKQLLKSSFSGTDYVLEGYGRQLGGRVWGLGVRSQDRRNSYTLSLYEDLDGSPLHNLHLYTWFNGGVTNDVYADLGNIDMNSWYKLKIKAHGNSFDFYFNDTYQNTSTDNTFSAGAIGLFGEQGTTAQFNDIRVRKYAATEPVTAVRGTQFNGFQWTGEGGSSAWNNASNWFSCTVPPALSDVAIFNGPFDPVISGITVTCNNLVIEPSGSLTINEDGGLTAASITINSSSASNGGSLINYGTNTLTATYNRFLRPESNYGDRHFFSSPVGGQLVSGFITTNQSKIHQIEGVYQIWSYKETDGSWPIVSSGVLESGTGYNIDQATGSDGLLAFTGSVVKTASFLATSPYANYNGNPRSSRADYGDPAYTTDENIWEYPRTWTNYGGGGWNLMGNPFTSALDAAEFVSENTGKFDPNYLALYLYDGNSATPRYRYAAAAVPFDPGYEEGGFFNENIQTGQGFFVLALHNELWFDFTPAMQIHNNGVTMLKSADTQDPWPGLRLKVKYGNNESQTTIIYNNAMTTGLDPGYDVGQLSAGPDVEVYTSLLVKDNSVNYARQALPLTDYGKNVIPVGIDTENGGEVTFSAYAVPIENSKFWLEDRVTGTYTDLTSGSYTVTLPAKTYGTGRFYIIASANTPTGIEKPGSDDADLRVWTSNGKLIIKGEVSGRAMCEIYDLRGQKIMETNLLDNYLNTVTLPSGLRGVYLVRVVDGVQIMTQKVALF